jgi:AAA15 family ATPase/GTPase
MSNQIGFNNFKAFGPQMQYFTKKPITLVYGPNSVGKSSLLHSQIYLDSQLSHIDSSKNTS